MFRWLRDLWQSYTVEDVATIPYQVVINNTPLTGEQLADAFPEHRNQLTGDQTLQGAQGFYGQGLFAGYTQQIQVPIDYGQQQMMQGQQQLARQQVAALQAYAEQQVFTEGTYGAMMQAQQNRLLFGDTYATFLIELKANGMEEPAIKNGDLLGLEPSLWKLMVIKLNSIASSSIANKHMYGKLADTLRYMTDDIKTTYKGDWGYDETIGDYLIQTRYCNVALPLSIFVKLPTTMKDCIEVMEKSLWSSRKSPITKKDIL